MKDHGTALDRAEALSFLALLGTAEILQKLGLPENIEINYKNYSAENAKEYFLIKSLISTQTAGVAMKRWIESSKTIADEKHRGWKSQQLAAILTDQSAWQRKLAEILTLLICFSESNESIYYYHYLLTEDLARCLYSIREQQEYFHSESAIANHEQKDLLAKLRDAEHAKGFKLSKCWYLSENSLISERKTKIKPGLMCSINSLIKIALEKARKFEKRALGYTYYNAISVPSENIHFNPLPSSQQLDEARFRFGCSQSGLLAISIIARSQEMLDIFPDGQGCATARTAVKNDPVRPAFARKLDVGDFVIVDYRGEPFLGQVLSIRESKYGNASYEVEFLAEKPLQSLEKDWIMANRCSEFMTKHSLSEQVLYSLEQTLVGVDNATASKIRDPSMIEKSMREAVRELWDRAKLRDRLIEARVADDDDTDSTPKT
jgi:hypothetical protein